MNDSTNLFGRWLDATMQSRGLSQAEVAREVGVADAQVSRWRRGQVRPSVHYLQRIADTFGVPRADLDGMVGYPVLETRADASEAESDPQHEAEIQAYQARYRQTIERKIPRRLWSAYAAACEALAERLNAAFEEAAGAVEHIEEGRPEETHDSRGERNIGFHLKD